MNETSSKLLLLIPQDLNLKTTMLRDFILTQDIYRAAEQQVVNIKQYDAQTLKRGTAEDFSKAVEETGHVGLAGLYGHNGVLYHLLVATRTSVLVLLNLRENVLGNTDKKKKKSGWDLMKTAVLMSPYPKYAFHMDRLALALHQDLGLRITGAIDLLSHHPRRLTVDAFLNALGGKTYEDHIEADNARQLFRSLEMKQRLSRDEQDRLLSLEAWLACHAATLSHVESGPTPHAIISTDILAENELDLLAATFRDLALIAKLKPAFTKNEVSSKVTEKNGKFQLTSQRYKTRVMQSSQRQYVEIVTKQGDETVAVKGRVTRVNGREATVAFTTASGKITPQEVVSFTTFGREDPTQSEILRSKIVLQSLSGTNNILTNPFVKSIFLAEDTTWDELAPYPSPDILKELMERPMNPSQIEAVDAIMSHSDEDRVVLVQGPPGTGKTTVIGAAALVIARAAPERTLWLVAQSNVAVKNIAEKLAALHLTDFKILVSKEFHYDWHEDLYDIIEGNMIRSDEFVDDVLAMARLILDSRIMLCTLSMLSNVKLGAITRMVPVETVIFDEASQIEIGNYFPPIHLFPTTLKKMIFIGDDKQLAPHGQGDIKHLKSIFEQPHLRERAVFLDTQYRMPVPIGDFISENMYEGRLKTCHPVTNMMSCQFIDAAGVEKKQGTSWVNEREAQAICRLAKWLEKEEQAYMVITPYDAQRSLLQRSLKDAGLEWENKCFNVDSFQGNEANYILISVVRTERLGFLFDDRRVNVMLTRCKKGMMICTNRDFIENIAPHSLVGKLAREWDEESEHEIWIDFEDLLND